jgi:hypothetical protein
VSLPKRHRQTIFSAVAGFRPGCLPALNRVANLAKRHGLTAKPPHDHCHRFLHTVLAAHPIRQRLRPRRHLGRREHLPDAPGESRRAHAAAPRQPARNAEAAQFARPVFLLADVGDDDRRLAGQRRRLRGTGAAMMDDGAAARTGGAPSSRV